jgi:hypothetical protein
MVEIVLIHYDYSGRPLTAASLGVRKHQCLRFFYLLRGKGTNSDSLDTLIVLILVHLVWSNGDALIL